MSPSEASTLKSALVGVPPSAEKPNLLEYAVRQHAEPQYLEALGSPPERE